MNQEFHAIYENGTLRLLSPLRLPESAEVVGTLQEKGSSEPRSAPVDPLLGLMLDESELLDHVVSDALVARECHPFRAKH